MFIMHKQRGMGVLKRLEHRLNMEIELDLTSLFGLLCTAVYSFAETPQHPPPRIRAHIRGRYWSAKTDDISL
jgi:hypothetical protein